MGFAERSVDTCIRDWSDGRVVETHVRDVMRCREIDVTRMEEFLGPEHSHEVRWAAARIISEKGRIAGVVKAVLLVPGDDRDTLLRMLSVLGKKEAWLTELEGLISSEDTMVRDAAVEMFRRAGDVDALFPLIFSEDDSIVQRIKRYINEARRSGETCGSGEPA